MTQRKTRLIILVIILIPPVFIITLLMPSILRKDNPGFFARENIGTISSALTKYRATYGELPQGDSATIFRTLEGANTNNDVFIEAAKTNAAGEILDSWGSPYKIQIDNGTHIVIRSPGKNRIPGDADDVVYDSAIHDFVTQP